MNSNETYNQPIITDMSGVPLDSTFVPPPHVPYEKRWQGVDTGAPFTPPSEGVLEALRAEAQKLKRGLSPEEVARVYDRFKV